MKKEGAENVARSTLNLPRCTLQCDRWYICAVGVHNSARTCRSHVPACFLSMRSTWAILQLRLFRISLRSVCFDPFVSEAAHDWFVFEVVLCMFSTSVQVYWC